MKTKIAITIEAEMLKEIDKLAEKLELNRSQLIENLISIGVADAQVLKTIGLLDLGRLVVRVKDKLQLQLSQSRKSKPVLKE